MEVLVEKKSECGIGWDLRSEGKIEFVQISSLTSQQTILNMIRSSRATFIPMLFYLGQLSRLSTSTNLEESLFLLQNSH